MDINVHFEEDCAMRVPKISRAEYDTILLHAEKISNGQYDFILVLRRGLHDKLNIADAEFLIAVLMTNKDVVGDYGAHYQHVKCGNFCKLDLVEKSYDFVYNDTSLRVSSNVGIDTTELIELPIELS